MEKDLLKSLAEELGTQDSQENKKLLDLLHQPEMAPLLALAEIQNALGGKHITDSMPGGFFIYEARGAETVLYTNQALVRLFGCETKEELLQHIGNSFKGIVHPDDYERVTSSIWNQIGSSRYDLDYVEYRILRKDGSECWVDDYGHYLKDADGRELFYVFVADASEKRQRQLLERSRELEAINRELRQRLKIIQGFSAEYASIFYADLDEDRVQPYQVSDRLADIAAPGQSLRFEGFDEAYIEQWVHPEDRDRIRQATDPAYIRYRLERDKVYRTNYRVVQDGRSLYFQLQIADAGGQTPGSQVVLGYRMVDEEIRQDMQQKELLENALRRANTAAQAKRVFLSNMSHDIRTPMNAVIGLASIAKAHLDDKEKILNCLAQIEASGEEMVRILGDMLEVSRVESEQAELEETSLPAVVEAAYSKLLPIAQEKKISFTTDLTELHHGEVSCDGEKLRDVLERLLINALEYTPQGGWVRLRVEERGAPTRDYASYHFHVEDSGIGIREDFLKRIFEPFERQQSSTLSGVSGVGLGLTIARSSVELMGGTITAKSQVGKGSTFTVSLSLRIREERNREDGTGRPKSGKPTSRKILLAEDNELNRIICQELLADAGYTVDSAENGAEAVELLKRAKPGEYLLVLMDIQMPVMDGNEAARAIRQLSDPGLASIPILALSANALEEDRKKSMESGMNGHMAKPIQISELLTMIGLVSGIQDDN